MKMSDKVLQARKLLLEAEKILDDVYNDAEVYFEFSSGGTLICNGSLEGWINLENISNDLKKDNK